ncbi:ZIP family metal transporter [Candidatus Woesearchaeota archaeon]|nr:ZIP family metal transporter [Candidatus Woesearchaeota archaeon]
MLETWVYTLVSVLIISFLSLIGAITLSLKREKLNHVLLYFISFSAGALFGDALIHLLPEAVKESGFSLNISLYILLGIIISFIVEKIIHWRHCHIQTKEHVHPFALMNLFGDAVHNLLDGVIIGASYIAGIPLGIATTLAVIFHEIPQEIGDFGVLLKGGFSVPKALTFNFLTALTSVIGAILALLLSSYINGLTNFLVASAAGGFIYIAGSDLIPELHKERKISGSTIQLITFILGIAIMVALTFTE